MSIASFPLVRAFLAFLAGLLAAIRFGAPPLLAVLAAGLFLALAASLTSTPRPKPRERAVAATLLLAFMAAGAAFGANAARSAAADCRTRFPEGAALAARGLLAANVPDAIRPGEAPLLPVRMVGATVQGRLVGGCTGEIRVRVPAAAEGWRAGTEVQVTGRWMRSAGPAVSSAWPREPRFSGHLAADSMAVVEPPSFATHPLLTLRGRTAARLRQLFPDHAALAEALLLGRREMLDPELRDRFVNAGLIHLLAISGAHVGLLATMIFLAGLILGRFVRVPRRVLAGASILLIAGYLAMIGAPRSAIRAGIMITLALLGLTLQRPHAAAPVIAAAAWLILARDPLAVLDPGFQLSFAGVIGIVALRGALLRHLPASVMHHKPLRMTAELAVVSGAAFLFTAPVAAYHFGQIAPIAILANLPAMPLMALALAGIVLALVTTPIALPLAHFFAAGAGFMLDLLSRVAALAETVPGGHGGVARPDRWMLVVAAAALLLALDAAGKLRARLRWGVAGAAVAAVLLAWPAAGGSRAVSPEIYFLDVGQGDAIAIRSPADRWILVDAGPRSDRFDAGERRILPFLRARGVHRLEAVILTHPDADHIGGAPAVLRGIPVGRLIEPGMPAGKPLYLETLREAESRDVGWAAARAGRSLQLDGMILDFLWPEAAAVDSATEANAVSVVLRLRYNEFSAILTGDTPTEVEQELVRRFGDALHADVIKIGHHGSRTSTSPELLDAVRPELAVITVGRRNRYGHPAPEVLRRLESRGVEIARTDRQGTIGIRLGATGRDWARMVP